MTMSGRTCLATAPEVAETTGAYFVNRKRAEPSGLARDAGAAKRLWALSEELSGLNGAAEAPPS